MNPIILTLDGHSRTIKEWSKINGIPPDTMKRRYKVYGWSVRRTLTTPVILAKERGDKAGNVTRRKYELFTVDGVTSSISGHAKRYGIDRKTVSKRIHDQGMTLEQALKTEVKACPAWLCWEDKLVMNNLYASSKEISKMLPRHTHSAVKVRQLMLRNKVDKNASFEAE